MCRQEDEQLKCFAAAVSVHCLSYVGSPAQVSAIDQLPLKKSDIP